MIQIIELVAIVKIVEVEKVEIKSATAAITDAYKK